MRRTLAAGLAGALTVGLLAGPVRASSGTSLTATGVLPSAPATGRTANQDGEPAVAAAPDGTLWATAFTLSDPAGGQDIWRSTDGGQSWQWVAAPFNIPPDHPLLGGDDADVAVATTPNASGHYNVYVAGLWVATSLGSLLVGDISLAVSSDGGHTWTVDPLAAELPGDDRPWLATDGACTVDLVYHALPTISTIVNTYDLCNPVTTVLGLTLVPVASSRLASLVVPALLGQKYTYVLAGFGKAMIDNSPTSPYRHRLYIPQMDCPGLTLLQELQRGAAADSNCPAGSRAEVYVAVSLNGGLSWREVPVAESQNNEVSVWPDTLATDAAGRVYLAWHDDHDAWLQTSSNGGLTWSPPVELNAGPGTAVYPTVTASGNGVVDVAWYAADRSGDANDQTVMGAPGAAGAATWSLEVARSRDGGQTFQTFLADPAIHTGMLWTFGDACRVKNSRDLFDDFGATTSPTTGQATVLYTSDQPGTQVSDDAIHWVTFASH